MRVAQRIELSLTKQRVEKLIVCLGHDDGAFTSHTRGGLPAQLSQRLLQQCQPGPSDVHNPDITRANARDREGRPRTFFAAHDQQQRRSRRGRRETLRTPQTWDTTPVADFMGCWCDRLLLGPHQRPSRCAVLTPQVPPLLWGEAVARVAQAHRHLRVDDVLVVQSATSLPFGLARLRTESLAGAPSASPTSAAPALHGATSVGEALKLFGGASCTPSVLSIGIGDAQGPQSLLSVEESAEADRLLLPLCTFTAAFWAANPSKAAAYIADLTATAASLTEAKANHRLWATMQHAMLSTRDTALLRAYFTDEALDARLSPAQTRYFAETLLQRLREEELRR